MPRIRTEDIDQLVANVEWLQGQSIGGSPRWSIRVSESPSQSIQVYYGDTHSWTGSGGDGADLADALDDRVDTSQLGGTFYDTWEHAKSMWGGKDVIRISLAVDSGSWMGNVQELNVLSADVNGNHIDVPNTVIGTPTVISESAPVQTNAVPAKIVVEKRTSDPTVYDAIEQPSSAQGDTSGFFLITRSGALSEWKCEKGGEAATGLLRCARTRAFRDGQGRCRRR